MSGLWTNNWTAIKNAFLCGDFIPGISMVTRTDGTQVVTQREDSSGTVDDRGARSFTSPMGAYVTGAAASGSMQFSSVIFVGTGSAAPAASDWRLASQAQDVSYLSCVKERPVYSVAAGTVETTIKLTLQNTAAASQTIREWGIFNGTYAGTPGFCMLYRALLDNPVTLQPYQAATLTLTLSVDFAELPS